MAFKSHKTHFDCPKGNKRTVIFTNCLKQTLFTVWSFVRWSAKTLGYVPNHSTHASIFTLPITTDICSKMNFKLGFQVQPKISFLRNRRIFFHVYKRSRWNLNRKKWRFNKINGLQDGLPLYHIPSLFLPREASFLTGSSPIPMPHGIGTQCEQTDKQEWKHYLPYYQYKVIICSLKKE